jgi:esterase/lipase superfamily enzyme
MKVEYHKWWSPNIGYEMELKVYGHWGIPFLVFPCAGGTFHEYEDFGMVDTIKDFIESGKMKLYTIGSLDNESWLSNKHPAEKARRHLDYDRYVVEEVIPFIYNDCNGKIDIYTTGNSLGAYHSANFFFKHPHIFKGCLALSGIYRLNHFVGEYMDTNVYYNSPLHYLPNLTDKYYLNAIKSGKITICVGQGAWDEECLADTIKLKEILENKSIPHWIDIWGKDVNHDWPWWKKQIRYFLPHIVG